LRQKNCSVSNFDIQRVHKYFFFIFMVILIFKKSIRKNNPTTGAYFGSIRILVPLPYINYLFLKSHSDTLRKHIVKYIADIYRELTTEYSNIR